MSQVIIYPLPNNSIAIVSPTGMIPLEETAKKDIPFGIPYLLIDDSILPIEHDDLFEAWEADFSEPHGVGADYGAGSDWSVLDYDENGAPKYLVHIATREEKVVDDNN